MPSTARSSNFSVRIDDGELLRRIERAGGKTALSRIATTLKAEAEALKDAAEESWPVSRTNTGQPWPGKDHSRDDFVVTGRLTPQVVSYSVGNTAPYAYYVRSYQIGESENASRRRYFWRRGTSPDDFSAQMTVGRKRHAWTTLVVRPANRASKRLADQIGNDLQELMDGR